MKLRCCLTAVVFLTGCISSRAQTQSGDTVTGKDLPEVQGAGKIDDNSRPPRPLVMKNPEIPRSLQKVSFDLVVKIQFVVRTDGRVVVTKIIGCPYRELNEAIVVATRSWRFEPGVKHGELVNTRMGCPLNIKN